jgi:hypothetical protein
MNTKQIRQDEWSASRPGHFTPGERVLDIDWGPRVGLDDVERRKILPLPRPELRPLGRPAHSQCSPRNFYDRGCSPSWGRTGRVRGAGPLTACYPTRMVCTLSFLRTCNTITLTSRDFLSLDIHMSLLYFKVNLRNVERSNAKCCFTNYLQLSQIAARRVDTISVVDPSLRLSLTCSIEAVPKKRASMHQEEVKVQLRFPAALLPGKDALVPGAGMIKFRSLHPSSCKHNCKLSHSRFPPCLLQLIMSSKYAA